MNHSFARLEEAFDNTSEASRSRSRSQSPSPSEVSNETLVIGQSRSPSVLSGVSSPISSLDTDDYDSDRDSVNPHEFRSPEPAPEMVLRNVRMSNSKTRKEPERPQTTESNQEVIRQILRIQKDIQKITREESQDRNPSVPFIEIGLFVSVGLFVLLAMNMMLQMGKQHVTYRFSSYD